MIRKASIAASLAALFVAAATTVALADNAIVTRDSYVYEDNHVQSDILGVVEEGQYVDVIDCGVRWCFLDIRGPNGYIRKNRLAFNMGPIYRDDDYYFDDDDVDVDVNLGFGFHNRSGFSFGFGFYD